MQHLDEGTVHAWLDGELSAADSAAAAGHVAECAQCAGLVAEARGMVAGAARIVAALDAGPAGVIPQSRHGSAPAPSGFWRRFVRSPSRMALAATIVVVAGLTLTLNSASHDAAPTSAAIDERVPRAPAPAKSASANPAPAATPPAMPPAEAKGVAAQTMSSTGTRAVRPIASGEPRAVASGSADASRPRAEASTLADKKKDADTRRDQPEPAKALAESRLKVEALPAAAPAAVRADSAASRQLLAKTAVDSIQRAPAAPAVRRVDATSGSPIRETAAQSQTARAAAFEAISEASLQGCYRLSVDTSVWQGVLPASFVLGGPPSQLQGAVRGGQGGAPAPANAVERLAQKPNPASYAVHVIGANGQVDSTPVGDWTAAGPMTARVRFMNVSQGRPVTLTISAASPLARVSAGDRTDSLRITRIVCQR